MFFSSNYLITPVSSPAPTKRMGFHLPIRERTGLSNVREILLCKNQLTFLSWLEASNSHNSPNKSIPFNKKNSLHPKTWRLWLCQTDLDFHLEPLLVGGINPCLCFSLCVCVLLPYCTYTNVITVINRRLLSSLRYQWTLGHLLKCSINVGSTLFSYSGRTWDTPSGIL